MVNMRYYTLVVSLLSLVALADFASRSVDTPVHSRNLAALPARVTQMLSPTPDHIVDSVARILARPLFSPTRRPLVTRPEQLTDSLRLSGIIVSPNGKVAIFQSTRAARPVVLSEGLSVGRWKAQTIFSDRVTLSDGAIVVTLRPTFATNGSAADVVAVRMLRARDSGGRHIQPPTFLERRE